VLSSILIDWTCRGHVGQRRQCRPAGVDRRCVSEDHHPDGQTLFSSCNVPIFLAFIIGMFGKGAGRGSGLRGMVVGTLTWFGRLVAVPE
jgi:hypothetical protein